PGQQDWTVSRNLVDMTGKLEVLKDLGVVRFDDIDLNVTRYALERYSFADRQVNSVRGETEWIMGFERDDWQVQTRTKTVLTSTVDDFHVYAELDAYEGNSRIAAKTWDVSIPRDFVCGGPMEILTSRTILRPADPAQTQAFYRDTLGLAIFREFGPPESPGMVFLCGNGLLEVSGQGTDTAGSAGHL